MRWLAGGMSLVILAGYLAMAVAAETRPAAAAKNAATKAGQDRPFWAGGKHYQLTGDVVLVENDGIHDPSNDTVKVLQQPYEAMSGFPRDTQGILDWVKVLDDGKIAPRGSIDGSEEMFPVDFDIIFKNTASMPFVRFPHRPHTEWLTCANCHPAIFIPQKGANPITMSQIIEGKYCGVCHGKVAFPPTMNCGRCHSVAREAILINR
ncbi:MAG: cytochrome c3 family protein [Gammaproteobacteria bacterium]|nr:cytochrome c3 family protein [Gammaproteobacteria bacterium]